MPSPNASLATLRPDLMSMVQLDLEAQAAGFIAREILRPIDVDMQSGNFGIIPIAQLLQTQKTTRAPGASYNSGTFTFFPVKYSCDEHGWEEPVDDRDAKRYANYLVAETIAGQRARHIILQDLEVTVAGLCNSTATFSNAQAGGSSGNVKWSSHATCTPREDVLNAVMAVWLATGLKPNLVQITWQQLVHLVQCQEWIDLVKYVQKGTPEAMASLAMKEQQPLADFFGVPRVVVADAAQNTANEGQAASQTTANAPAGAVSISSIWDSTKVFVGRVAAGQDIRQPCVGRIFHWAADGSTMDVTMESYREEKRRSDIIRARQDVGPSIIYSNLGYLITSVL